MGLIFLLSSKTHEQNYIDSSAVNLYIFNRQMFYDVLMSLNIFIYNPPIGTSSTLLARKLRLHIGTYLKYDVQKLFLLRVLIEFWFCFF